jgi:hypothetical protein
MKAISALVAILSLLALAVPAQAGPIFGEGPSPGVNQNFAVGFVDTTVLFLVALVIILALGLIVVLVLQGNTRFLLTQTEKKIEDKAFDIIQALEGLERLSELDRQVLRNAVARQTENASLQDAKDVFQTISGGQKSLAR